MASHVHLGHVFHVAGSPLVTGAADALVSIPDGALVIDEAGEIVFCGERAEVPADTSRHGARPSPRLPAARLRRHPRALPPDLRGRLLRRRTASGVAQSVHLPVRVQVRRSRVRAAGRRRVLRASDRGRHHRGDGVRFGVPARSRRAVHRDQADRACASSAAAVSRRSAPRPPRPLITSEADAIRLTRAEIEKWHARGHRRRRTPRCCTWRSCRGSRCR